MTVYLIYSGGMGLIQNMIFLLLTVHYVVNVGMNPLQLVLVGTVLEGTIMLLEVPTGVVADTYSRRLSVILGVLLFGVAYLLQGFLPLFVAILIAEVIRGIGETFMSGAFDAWLADEIGEENLTQAYLRGSQVSKAGGIAGVVLGALLGSLHLAVPVAVGGGLALLLGLFLMAAMPETGFKPAPRTEKGPLSEMATTFRDGFRTLRFSPMLLLFAGVAFVSGVASEGWDRLADAHLVQTIGLPQIGNLPVAVWFGAMNIGFMLFGIGLQQILRRRLQNPTPAVTARYLMIATGLRVAGMIGFAFAPSFAVSLGCFALIAIGWQITGPLTSAWMAQHIDSRVRATVLSLNSQANAIGQVAGGPGVGWIGTVRGLRAAIATTGLLLAPMAVLYGALGRQGQVQQEAAPAQVEQG